MAEHSQPVIAVVGATGAVGEAMLSILEQRLGRNCKVHALASERSVGKQAEYGRQELDVDDLAGFNFKGVDYALFSAGAEVSKVHALRAAKAGATVIDNTSAFRYQSDIPLVVPEVNGHLLEKVFPGGIVANPNCSTIQLVMAIAPIHRAVGIERINVATYQSVSGAGRAGMEELARQTADRLGMRAVTANKFAQPIAFNAVPEIDAIQDNGYTREEMKLQWETSKILEDEDIRVNATAVRVPVFYGHSEAVHLETGREISIDEVRKLLSKAPGLSLVDNQERGFATAVTHAAGHDEVFVSRLRRDHTHPRGINLWVVADNLRKGAALNAVQILQQLLAIRASAGARVVG